MYRLRTLHFLRRSLTAFNDVKRYSNRVFEPEYLDVSPHFPNVTFAGAFGWLQALKPSIPQHDTLNIYLRSYDYPVLENYQKLVHKLAVNMDIEVEESWPLPHQDWNVKTFKPNSELVNTEYKLKMYQRVVQVTDVSTSQVRSNRGFRNIATWARRLVPAANTVEGVGSERSSGRHGERLRWHGIRRRGSVHPGHGLGATEAGARGYWFD